ncbi:hypothetical protein [Paenibacillus oleatilyticus]|uniref:hypothetical protein n=1 Tax=Paenibacillus oleatilyticus TaxID=2594886 RepID=UPI001C1F7941|nr:hypothetical protein [Paenibacillus oleatilyticus]MBU7316069.1 hypothetical protein [Paenibacillus oleatilyticus]
MRTLSQIDYAIDELLQEKEAVKQQEVEDKIAEFTKIMVEMPPKDSEDLSRLLRMFARDVKYITEK